MASTRDVDYEDYLDHDDSVVSGEAVMIPSRPAGFIQRAAGAAIDLIALGILTYLAVTILATVILSLSIDDALSTALTLMTIITVLLIVPIVVETLTHGKSLGRLVMGLRIVRDDGGAIGLRHSMIRGFMSLIDFYLTFGGTALIVGMLNSRAKRVGDLLAGTYSQRERLPALTVRIFGVPVELIEWAQTADVARMPDGLSRRISSFLDKAPNLTAVTRDRLARQLANEASTFVAPIPPVGAETFLAGVIALRRDRETQALTLEAGRLEKLQPVLRGLPHQFPRRMPAPSTDAARHTTTDAAPGAAPASTL
jgi:uncharacterized RDD family membrane protein YckC